MSSCWIMLALSGWNEIFYWSAIGEPMGGAHITVVGLGLFGLMNSLLLSRDHSVTLRRSDDLDAELVTRVRLLETHDRENLHLTASFAGRSRTARGSCSRRWRSAVRASPPRPSARGQLVDDRYRVVRAIGQGRLGTVYEVFDCPTRLASRSRSPPTSTAPRRRARRRSPHVCHPNVVGILDVGVATTGFLYLVLELVEGPRSSNSGSASVTWRERSRIVHRDLKPANVLVTARAGSLIVKITDFGISRRVIDARVSLPPASSAGRGAASRDSADADTTILAGGRAATIPPGMPSGQVTQAGLLIGTPLYMAPELAEGSATPIAAADVFAFGVLAHEILTGKLPFDEAPVLLRLRSEALPAPPQLASDNSHLSVIRTRRCAGVRRVTTSRNVWKAVRNECARRRSQWREPTVKRRRSDRRSTSYACESHLETSGEPPSLMTNA